MLHLHHLIDDAKCYEKVRRLRWPYAVRCPHCESNKITKRGRNHRHQACRRYRCNSILKFLLVDNPRLMMLKESN